MKIFVIEVSDAIGDVKIKQNKILFEIPLSGLGTTGIACRKYNWGFIGIEIN